MTDLEREISQTTGNPVIDQRYQALRDTWAHLLGMPAEDRRKPGTRDDLVEHMRASGFKTKAVGMRGSARYADAMLTAASGRA